MSALLIVTAVEAERAAIEGALPHGAGVRVLVVGVGPAAAAAGTATALAAARPDLVLCAGIGGGFDPLAPGDIAVATRSVFADLGAETDAGFVPVSELGFGSERYEIEPAVTARLAERTGGVAGAILTVATVTGTAATAARLRDAIPTRSPRPWRAPASRRPRPRTACRSPRSAR